MQVTRRCWAGDGSHDGDNDGDDDNDDADFAE